MNLKLIFIVLFLYSACRAQYNFSSSIKFTSDLYSFEDVSKFNESLIGFEIIAHHENTHELREVFKSKFSCIRT